MKNYLSILINDFGDNHHLKRYSKVINYYTEYPVMDGEYHHVLPRSLYPDMVSDRDNLILLPTRVHYIVHWMLAKGTNSNKMWFAFNMMNRVIQSSNKTSSLYRQAREYISNAISECNTGRIVSDEQKEALSKAHTGMVTAKDSNGVIKRLSVDDERYLSGEYVHHKTGSKHKDETIQKMKRNGIRGRLRYKNINTNKFKYFKEDDEIGESWVIDNGDLKERKPVLNTVFYHDPDTKINVRIKEGEPVSQHLVKGRYFKENKGFDKANQMTNVVDLKDRVCKKVHNVESHHAKESGLPSNKTKVMVYAGKIFTSWVSLENQLIKDNIFIERESIKDLSTKVKKPHHNCKPEINEFRKKFMGSTIDKFGICVYSLTDFNYYDHKDKEIVWN